MFDYAYHLPFELFTVSFGSDISYNEISIDQSQLITTDPNDPLLNSNNFNYRFLQSSAGIQLTNEQFFISIAARNLLKNKNLPEEGFYRNNPDAYLCMGTTLRLNRFFSIEPSVFFTKQDGRSFDWYANTRLYFKSYNWISVSYRSTGIIKSNLAINVIENFQIGYGYEFYINNLSGGTYSGHTIFLGRNFGLRNIYGIRKNVKQGFL